jgi:hypothetical protein
VLAYTTRNSPAERILTECGPAFVAVDPRESDELEDAKVAAFLCLPLEQRAVSPRFEERFNAQTQARKVADMLDALLKQ